MTRLARRGRRSASYRLRSAAGFCVHIFAAFFLPVIFAASVPSLLFAQGNAAGSVEKLSEPEDSGALVRAVVHNELESERNDHSLWCFREQRQVDSKATKTLGVCGSPDGDLERLVAIDGRQLSPSEEQAEEQRIKKWVNHPAQLRAKQKKSHEDDEQFQALLKAFPDAFEFEYVRTTGDLVTLHFRPNPEYHPSTRAESVFHHMEGTLVVDRKQERIAEIVGLITSEVKFLGGLLGHLDRGGTFVVKAGEVAPGHWDTTLMNLELSGKALFFKIIAIHQDETYADYTPVLANATLPQVAELLKKECESIHIASNR